MRVHELMNAKAEGKALQKAERRSTAEGHLPGDLAVGELYGRCNEGMKTK